MDELRSLAQGLVSNRDLLPTSISGGLLKKSPLCLQIGIHACVGQMIARMEAEAVLGALARRVETIELNGEPQRRLNNTLRAIAHLPVKVRPAR